MKNDFFHLIGLLEIISQIFQGKLNDVNISLAKVPKQKNYYTNSERRVYRVSQFFVFFPHVIQWFSIVFQLLSKLSHLIE